MEAGFPLYTLLATIQRERAEGPVGASLLRGAFRWTERNWSAHTARMAAASVRASRAARQSLFAHLRIAEGSRRRANGERSR